MNTSDSKKSNRKAFATLDANRLSTRIRTSKSSNSLTSIETIVSSTIPSLDDSDFAFLEQPTTRKRGAQEQHNSQRLHKRRNYHFDEPRNSRRKTPRTSNCSTSSMSAESSETEKRDERDVILTQHNFAHIETQDHEKRIKDKTRNERRKRLWKKHLKRKENKVSYHSGPSDSSNGVGFEIKLLESPQAPDISENAKLSICSLTQERLDSSEESRQAVSMKDSGRPITPKKYLQHYTRRSSSSVKVKRQNLCSRICKTELKDRKPISDKDLNESRVVQEVDIPYKPDDGDVWKAIMKMPHSPYCSPADNLLDTVVTAKLRSSESWSAKSFDNCSALTGETAYMVSKKNTIGTHEAQNKDSFEGTGRSAMKTSRQSYSPPSRMQTSCYRTRSEKSGIYSLQKQSESLHCSYDKESPEFWTADHAALVHPNDKFGNNSAPIFTINGKLYQHPPLPPGWTIGVSKSKGRPYYSHPNFGITWYAPVPLPSRDGNVQGSSLRMHVDTDVEVQPSLPTTNTYFDDKQGNGAQYTDQMTPSGMDIMSKDPTFSSSNQIFETPFSSEKKAVKVTTCEIETVSRKSLALRIQSGDRTISGASTSIRNVPLEIDIDHQTPDTTEISADASLVDNPNSIEGITTGHPLNSSNHHARTLDTSPASFLISCSADSDFDLHENENTLDDLEEELKQLCTVQNEPESKKIQEDVIISDRDQFVQSLDENSAGNASDEISKNIIHAGDCHEQDANSIDVTQAQAKHAKQVKIDAVLPNISERMQDPKLKLANLGSTIRSDCSLNLIGGEITSTPHSSPPPEHHNASILSEKLKYNSDNSESTDSPPGMKLCFNHKGSSHRIRVGYETWRALTPKLPVCSLQKTQRANMEPTKGDRMHNKKYNAS
jgi:hypothetical protein